MGVPVDDFATLMALEPHGPDVFVGTSPDYDWGRVYGGQVVAQGLWAATSTVDADHHVHSVHAYFIRGGSSDEPIRYEVDRIRNGRSFVTRRVVARQSEGAILNLACSFQAAEEQADVQESVLPDDVGEPGSGTVEDWEALVRPSRRVPPGTPLSAGDDLVVTVGDDLGEGRRRVRLEAAGGVLAALDRHGEMPLPPYLSTVLEDPDRYQTVYADRRASAAAPTAGLHLTDEVLDACRAAGARVERLELVVGLDTFRPVTVDDLDDHEMHSEAFSVPDATFEACVSADRVIAVGTTTVRALEAAARGDQEGRTDLFIRRPFDFRVVDVLLTNYHLPGSTLLVLLDAFAGPRWRQLYATALAEGYRFLSFGDAMLVARDRQGGAA